MTDLSALTSDELQLLNVVPIDGSTIGNQRARETVGLGEDLYFTVRNGLIEKGLIVKGQGRGGTIRRVLEVVAEPDAVVSPIADTATVVIETVREDALYEPILGVLRGAWTRDRQLLPLDFEITARQGRRSTGGTWSRPDLVSVEIKTYEYVPGKFLEVTTFEVKPADAIDVQAVYEALAHRRSSTHAYVLLHIPQEEVTVLEDSVRNVRLVARSHGIGVITIQDPADYNTWEELEEAQRVEPDPERLNQFIETQLSEKLRKKIARTLR
ncbi:MULTISPECIES: hypothetical protein [Arthrobacter]|uniref:CYTH domain-containing protein n=2 Tax=Arthrobacter TaxID=1663 RepID=A0ABU9KMP2_9MICC|nr:hypothetical protein [Arthrobacter sp. YJM1]MDP5227174.1 hypothetical protein [Arthrobacter sp. YJM1]